MEQESASNHITMMQRAQWYVLHRIEYLQNRQNWLRQQLSEESPNYDLLREFMENKGRLQELRQLSDHMTRW